MHRPELSGTVGALDDLECHRLALSEVFVPDDIAKVHEDEIRGPAGPDESVATVWIEPSHDTTPRVRGC